MHLSTQNPVYQLEQYQTEATNVYGLYITLQNINLTALKCLRVTFNGLTSFCPLPHPLDPTVY